MNRNTAPRSLSGKLSVWFAILTLAALLTACGAPAAAPASQPVSTEAPVATTAPTEAPAATEAPTEAPAATAAPTEAPAATGGSPVSFSADVMPIFQASCIKCHGGPDGEKADLDLRQHEAVMKGSENGAVVVAGDAANSLLVKLINEGKMPKRGGKLTAAQIDVITRWVNEGALNN